MAYVFFGIGVVLYVFAMASVATTLVIPRGHLNHFVKVVDQCVDQVYRVICGMARTYERRDALRASQGVVLLFLTLVSWVTLLILALGLMELPSIRGILPAIREAGASFLTLGFTSTPTVWASVIDFLAGFTGLVVVALQISYLPTLYSAFNRRETEITLLASRSGVPSFGPEILARTRIGIVDAEVLGLYRAWERWAADVSETHSTYPALLRFRSPNAYNSWVVALLAVMDSAAMYQSIAPSQAPLESRLALRMGFECLRTIATTLGIPFDPDPSPNDPIQLTREEFDEALARLRSVGFPIERDGDDGWRHFQGWRVNYERIVYALAWQLDVVPAQWSGPRRFGAKPLRTVRVVNRTPENPGGGSTEDFRTPKPST